MRARAVGVIVAVVGLAVTVLAPAARAGDTVGLVDPTQGQWHLRNEAGQLTSFFFGNPGDVPVVGDWDCDGDATPGLFRTSDAFAYLSNVNASQIADIRFFFGNPSDVPLAGDWDGDGCDTLSIYRPSEQRFFVINELGQNEGGLGAADFDFVFGNPGDKPVVGDWDADGVDEVGLHRESTGFFYWRNTLDTGVAYGSMFFGDPGDRFVAGDWGMVDNVDTPAVFRPSNTIFFFRHTLSQGNADSQFGFGAPAWLPVAGDFGLDPPPPPPPVYPSCDFTPFTVTGGKATGGVAVVKDLVVPGDQPAIVELTGPPSGPGVNNFIVSGLDAAGNTIFDGGLNVNEGPSYKGTRPINMRSGFGPVRKIRVDANGDWTAVVKPICAAPKLTGTSISGTSHAVVQVDRSGTATLTHTGSSNFIVFTYQSATEREFVANELGPFTGTAAIAPGTDFIDITARGGGGWTVSLP